MNKKIKLIKSIIKEFIVFQLIIKSVLNLLLDINYYITIVIKEINKLTSDNFYIYGQLLSD